MTEIQGKVNKKFRSAEQAFRNNFIVDDEIGAALCVYHRGRKVVDLWGGLQNVENNTPWGENTVSPMFSATKGVAAIAFLLLQNKKKFQYSDLVSKYWPEFGRNKKSQITIKQVLEHTAGLPLVEEKLTFFDFVDNKDKIYHALLAQEPIWQPGTDQGYGAQVWGLYAAEIFQRIAGESVSQFLYREVFKPLKLSLSIGELNQSSEIARLYPMPMGKRIKILLRDANTGKETEGRLARASLKLRSMPRSALLNPSMGRATANIFNEPWVQNLELLAANGLGNARSLAKLYSYLAQNKPIGTNKKINKKSYAYISSEAELAFDKVVQKPLRWHYGFLKEAGGLFSNNGCGFGHAGMGGSLGWADPVNQISIGYVCNKLDHRVRAHKLLRICKAIYECV